MQVRGKKRFTSFLVTAALLAFGFFLGSPENFVTYAQMLAGLFFIYVTGQSATDFMREKNGQAG